MCSRSMSSKYPDQTRLRLQLQAATTSQYHRREVSLHLVALEFTLYLTALEVSLHLVVLEFTLYLMALEVSLHLVVLDFTLRTTALELTLHLVVLEVTLPLVALKVSLHIVALASFILSIPTLHQGQVEQGPRLPQVVVFLLRFRTCSPSHPLCTTSRSRRHQPIHFPKQPQRQL